MTDAEAAAVLRIYLDPTAQCPDVEAMRPAVERAIEVLEREARMTGHWSVMGS